MMSPQASVFIDLSLCDVHSIETVAPLRRHDLLVEFHCGTNLLFIEIEIERLFGMRGHLREKFRLVDRAELDSARAPDEVSQRNLLSRLRSFMATMFDLFHLAGPACDQNPTTPLQSPCISLALPDASWVRWRTTVPLESAQ
jgi:hypothetical protein